MTRLFSLTCILIIAGCTGADHATQELGASDPSELDAGSCLSDPIDIQMTEAPDAIGSADLNGDGIADLTVASANDAEGIAAVTTLLGDGESYAVTALYMVSNPTDIETGDFDGDGQEDVFALAYDGQGPLPSKVLFGAGDGTLLPVNLPQGGDYPAAQAATADIDLDGTTDIAMPLILDEQAGDPVLVRTVFGPDFTDRRIVDPAPGELAFGAVELGDMNGDGLADLVTAAGVQLGQPDGNFGAPIAFLLPAPPLRLHLADLDGDGNQDLIAAAQFASEIAVLLGDGTGNLGPATMHPVANEDAGAFASADFDGDGALDLAVGNWRASVARTVTIAYGDGTGGFAESETVNVSTGGATGLVAIDANLDEAPDLVATNRLGDTISLFLNSR
jgi:FG-GAP-like repeat